jgi:hypothetical protein
MLGLAQSKHMVVDRAPVGENLEVKFLVLGRVVSLTYRRI